MEIASFVRINCNPLQGRTVARVTASLSRLIEVEGARQRDKPLYVLP
jgi:hypothetical protein